MICDESLASLIKLLFMRHGEINIEVFPTDEVVRDECLTCVEFLVHLYKWLTGGFNDVSWESWIWEVGRDFLGRDRR